VGEQRLTRSGGANQQDVGLREFDLIVFGLVVKPLVMVVNRDRQHLLRMVLADDVIIENLVDFLRCRNAVTGFAPSGFGLLADDIFAQLNALIADVHRRPRDELADLVLALPAERAIERILRIAACELGHSCLPRFGTMMILLSRDPALALSLRPTKRPGGLPGPS
jgi:hypothetical protein